VDTNLKRGHQRKARISRETRRCCTLLVDLLESGRRMMTLLSQRHSIRLVLQCCVCVCVCVCVYVWVSGWVCVYMCMCGCVSECGGVWVCVVQYKKVRRCFALLKSCHGYLKGESQYRLRYACTQTVTQNMCKHIQTYTHTSVLQPTKRASNFVVIIRGKDTETDCDPSQQIVTICAPRRRLVRG
jgi:hypothetical protein